MCARCARVRASARVACARMGVDGFIFPAAAWLARALGFDTKRRGFVPRDACTHRVTALIGS